MANFFRGGRQFHPEWKAIPQFCRPQRVGPLHRPRSLGSGSRLRGCGPGCRVGILRRPAGQLAGHHQDLARRRHALHDLPAGSGRQRGDDARTCPASARPRYGASRSSRCPGPAAAGNCAAAGPSHAERHGRRSGASNRGVAVARGRARTPDAAGGRRFPGPSQPAAGTSGRSPSRRAARPCKRPIIKKPLPTPVPAGEVRRSPMAADPALEPSSHGRRAHGLRRPDGLRGPDGLRRSDGRPRPAAAIRATKAPCGTCCDDCCDRTLLGTAAAAVLLGSDGHLGEGRLLAVVGERHPRAALGHHADRTPANPGYIGEPGTVVLFGDDYINDKSVSGGRIQAGMWLNPCATFGFEGEYFALADENTNYYGTGPMATRSSPGRSTTSTPTTPSRERRIGRLSPRQRQQSRRRDQHQRHHPLPRRRGALPLHHLPPGRLLDRRLRSCTTYHDRFRADFIAGYRYLDLEDQLGITETLTTTSPTPVDPDESDRHPGSQPLFWSTISSTRRTRSTAAIWA